MHFPLLASLITTLGLVSVACAMPPGANPLKFKLFILDQDNPVASIGRSVPHDANTRSTAPSAVEKFFLDGTVLSSLGYAFKLNFVPRVSFTLQEMYASSFKIMDERLASGLPVYARFLGGVRDARGGGWKSPCYNLHSYCLNIIAMDSSGSPYGAIIETQTNTLIAQVGNPAIVSFLNPQPKPHPSADSDTIAKSDVIAKHMVSEWFLAEQSVWHALGLSVSKIIHIDSFPTDATEFHFMLYGGTKCSPKPCSGLVELVFVNHIIPTNQYHGVVYEPGGSHKLVELTHTVQ